MIRFVVLFVLFFCSAAQAWTHGAAFLNANSAVGINIVPSTSNGPGQQFADVSVMQDHRVTLKVTGTFNSASTSPLGGMTVETSDTDEEALVCVDANGNPTSNTNSLNGTICNGSYANGTNAFGLLVLLGQSAPYYAPGDPNTGGTSTYTVLYTPGQCNFIYTGDITSVSRSVSTGQDIVTVSPSSQGFEPIMTATGSGASQCQKLGVVWTPLVTNYIAGCLNGGTTLTPNISCFNPKYVQFLKSAEFNTLRTMEIACTNNNISTVSSNWSTRSLVTFPFYQSAAATSATGAQQSIACGIPMELTIALANYLNVDVWINAPILADISNFTGTIVSSILTASSVTGPIEVGLVVFGSGITPGAIIISSLGTGSGGAGTYNLTCSGGCPTISSSESMMGSGTAWATGAGALLATKLNSGLHAIFEGSNETWNGGFTQQSQRQTLGNDAFGCGVNPTCGNNWFGYWTQRECIAFKAAFSNAACTMGGQLGNTGTWGGALACADAPSPRVRPILMPSISRPTLVKMISRPLGRPTATTV